MVKWHGSFYAEQLRRLSLGDDVRRILETWVSGGKECDLFRGDVETADLAAYRCTLEALAA